MTRHRGFDVRVSPEVEAQIREWARTQRSDARKVIDAQDRLAREGTRAPGAKKLQGLDLWEIRAGRFRVFFCLVPRTNQLAIGAVLAKTARRIRMAKLKRVEREVHRWREESEQES